MLDTDRPEDEMNFIGLLFANSPLEILNPISEELKVALNRQSVIQAQLKVH